MRKKRKEKFSKFKEIYDKKFGFLPWMILKNVDFDHVLMELFKIFMRRGNG